MDVWWEIPGINASTDEFTEVTGSSRTGQGSLLHHKEGNHNKHMNKMRHFHFLEKYTPKLETNLAIYTNIIFFHQLPSQSFFPIDHTAKLGRHCCGLIQ